MVLQAITTDGIFNKGWRSRGWSLWLLLQEGITLLRFVCVPVCEVIVFIKEQISVTTSCPPFTLDMPTIRLEKAELLITPVF